MRLRDGVAFSYVRRRVVAGKYGGTVFLLSIAIALPVWLSAESAKPADNRGGNDPVFVGAGDIASCDDLSGAYATAKLIEKIPGTVFAVGDLAYPNGSDSNFANCYGPTWG